MDSLDHAENIETSCNFLSTIFMSATFFNFS